MVDQTLVGETTVPDGVVNQGIRSGRLNDLDISQLLAPYYENTRKGRTFCGYLSANTTTTAAGNISGASAAPSANFVLWNPQSPGTVNVVLLKVFIGVISGTPVGGPMFHNTFNASGVSATGTNGTNMLLGSATASVGLYSASAAGATITGGGAYSALRPANLNFSATAFASAGGTQFVEEDIDGDIVLPPGQGWAPCYKGAGTTLLTSFGVVWTEVPV